MNGDALLAQLSRLADGDPADIRAFLGGLSIVELDALIRSYEEVTGIRFKPFTAMEQAIWDAECRRLH